MKLGKEVVASFMLLVLYVSAPGCALLGNLYGGCWGGRD